MAEALAEALRKRWEPCGVANLASPGTRGLHQFKKQYLGMGRTNGDREQQARASVPAGTNIISMGGGLPEHSMLPFEDLMEFAHTAWAQHQPAPLEYGSTVDPSLLKQEIARYLSARRGHGVTQDGIFVTTGNQGGIESVARAYLGPGDVAIVESPLWTAAVNILTATGASCAMVGMDSEGIDIDAVATEIARAGGRVKLIYLQPLHHNPTGVSISFARAEALLRLAAEHQVLILADEAYEAFEYDDLLAPQSSGRRYAHLSTLSGGGHGVFTVHTFSKTLGTGLRLGYVHAQPNLLAALQESRLTQSSVFWEFTVAELMKSGRFERLVERARRNYGRKLRILCDALTQHAGQYLVPEWPNGGFFVWLTLRTANTAGTGDGSPDDAAAAAAAAATGCTNLRADQLHLELLSRGLMCGLGEHYYGPGMHDDGWRILSNDGDDDTTTGGGDGGGGTHLRLAFIGCSEEELHEAARRIGAACAALVASGGALEEREEGVVAKEVARL